MNLSKKDINIVEYISRYLPLRPAGSTKYVSACPFCEPGKLTGDDRFSVKPDMGLWNCNKCTSGKWYDVIRFVEAWEDTDYKGACAILGIDSGATKSNSAEFSQLKLHVQPPPEEWLNRAWERIAEAQGNLFSAPKAMKWLQESRGITEETIKRFKLGFFDKPVQLLEHITIPRGIVMPQIAVDGSLWGIKIATGTKEKYNLVQGSRKCLMGQGSGHNVMIIVEGDMDMYLALQEAGHLVDIVTLGSAQHSVPIRFLEYINCHPRIIPLYDNDSVGRMRQKQVWGWLNGRIQYPPMVLPVGKDVSEFVVEHKCSFVSWIENVLLPAITPPTKEYYPPVIREPFAYKEDTEKLHEDILDILDQEPIAVQDLKNYAIDEGYTVESFNMVIRDIQEAGYIVEAGPNLIAFQPLYRKNDDMELSVDSIGDKPYWSCTCGKIAWQSKEGSWYCSSCALSAGEPPQSWGTTRAVLKASKRPVFGIV